MRTHLGFGLRMAISLCLVVAVAVVWVQTWNVYHRVTSIHYSGLVLTLLAAVNAVEALHRRRRG